MSDVVAGYDREASELVQAYEHHSFEEIHGAVEDLLPDNPGFVLDVGAGSGRDSAWFARKGHTVVAVEPSTELRKAGQERHRSAGIKWMNDALPSLDRVMGSRLTFDLIWLSGIWMHVPVNQRPRALRKLVSVLRPGGSLMMSIRHGPEPSGRPMDPVTSADVETMARQCGLQTIRTLPVEDILQRPGISWEVIWLRLPDDGTGALPILRHVVFNDSKSSTYKLALLRSLIRIADSAGGFARSGADEQHVDLPLGLVSLFWIRSFRPLWSQGLPQHPGGNERLSFVKEGFRGLCDRSSHDLRVGQQFSGEDARNLIRALRDAAECIRNMPANFITYPGSSDPGGLRIFPCRRRPVRLCDSVRLDEQFLWSFGSFSVPVHLWQAMSRYAPWIEPAVLNEWIEVMRRYESDRSFSQDDYITALRWMDPEHDTRLVRDLGEQLRGSRQLFCVWTGRRIRRDFDVDHCMPYSAWPCNDLWNLLPSLPNVNRSKGDRLPAPEALERARPRILDWWEGAYLRQSELKERFEEEGRSALPALVSTDGRLTPEDYFEGVMIQQMVLKRDQQLMEWQP